jgi:acyl dehydratase
MSPAAGPTLPQTTDGTIVANLSYDDVEHPEPVRHGDTIRAETTVLGKRETSDGDRGVVRLSVEAFNQHDELVCSLERTVLSEKRDNETDS